MRTTSNFIFKKMLTVLLSAGLLVSSFSPVIVNADETTENKTGGGTETTEVVETDETPNTEVDNKDYSDNITYEVTYGDDNKKATIKFYVEGTEDVTITGIDSEAETVVPNEELTIYDDTDTSKSVYAFDVSENSEYSFEVTYEVLNSDDEYSKEVVVAVSDIVTKTTDENNESTTPKENSDVNVVDENTDTVYLKPTWVTSGDDNGTTTLDTFKWRTESTIQIDAKFPAIDECTDRTITIIPNASVIITDNDKKEETAMKMSVSSYNNGARTKALPEIDEKATTNSKYFNNVGYVYTFGENNSPKFNIKVANTTVVTKNGTNGVIISNGATKENLTNCIKVILSYKDLNGGEHEIIKYLSANAAEKSEFGISQKNDYKKDSDRLLVLQGQENVSTAESNKVLLQIGQSDSENRYTGRNLFLPAKNVYVTIQIHKNNDSQHLEIKNGANGDGTGDWVIESSKDIDSNTKEYVMKYKANDNFIINGYYSAYVNFTPSISIDDNATNGTKYELKVMSAKLIAYENYKDNGDGTATGEEKEYSFDNGSDPLCTAYYEVEDIQRLFVLDFEVDKDHNMKNNAVSKTLNDLAFYNDSYSDFEGIVAIFDYGCFGTRDLNENRTIKMNFDSTAIGVTGVNLPINIDYYNEIKKNEKTFTVYYKTTKSVGDESKSKTFTTIEGGSGTYFGYVNVDRGDLNLDDDEYITEIRYTITGLKAQYTTKTGVLSGECRSPYNFGWVIGVIKKDQTKDSTAGTTFENTIQIFEDEDCKTPATDKGVLVSSIYGEKRVNAYITGVKTTVTNKDGTSAGVEELKNDSNLKISGSISVYNQAGTSFRSAVIGYTPITAIYIRDLFGTGISNVTIKNTQTGDCLLNDVTIDDGGKVTNGTVAKGVTLTLDHTEAASTANNNYAVKVYKVTIDTSTIENYDNIIGLYDATKIYAADKNIATLDVSFDTTVPSNFESGTGDDGYPERYNDVVDTKYAIYAESDCNTEPSRTDIDYQFHNRYGGDNGAVVHADDFDVNGNKRTVYKNDSSFSSNDTQGDNLIVRAKDGQGLKMKRLEAYTDLEIESWFKEANQETEYRQYNEGAKEESTVDLTHSDAKLKLLIGNYGTTTITDFELYIPIPKKGQNWGIYSDNKAFDFSVNLLSELALENPTSYYEGLFTVTYANITPSTTYTGFKKNENDEDYTYEAFNVENASEYNCIRIKANKQLPFLGSDYKIQQDNTSYFYATVGYGDTDYANEEKYDVFKGYGEYHYKLITGGENNFNDSISEFGLRAIAQYKADGTVIFNGKAVDAKDATITLSSSTPFAGDTVTATFNVLNSSLEADTANIKVTVGGTEINTFTYDEATKTITVDGQYVTGDVHFEVPLKAKSYKAITTSTHGTPEVTSEEDVTYGTDYTSPKVTPEDNYKLPTKDKVTVKVGDKTLTSDEFEYDESTGKVTITGNKITGNIEITVPCTPKTFTVKTTTPNGSSTTTDTDTPTYGTPYTTTVTPNKGYELPKDKTSITVTVDGKEITDFEYDPNTGKVTVPGDKITGNIEITVPCTPKTFTVTTNVDNGTSTTTDTDTPTYGTPYTTTVTPNTNYELPKDKTSITVTVDGKPLNPEDFDYNEKTGEITVHGDKITGNIVINVPCNPIELDADGVDIIETSSTTIEVANSDKTGKYENILASIDVDKAYYNTELTATATVKNPNFKVDKDNISVEVKESDGSTTTYDADSEYVTISSNTNTGRSLKGRNIQAEEATTIYESYTVTLAASKVTGKVHFIVPLVENTPVETDVVNGKQGDNDGIKVEADPSNPLMTKEYTTEIKADDGYVLPSTIDAKTSDGSKAITIIIGGKEITDFTYTPILKDGKVVSATITIPGQSLLNATKLEYKINVVASKVNTNSNTNNNTNPPKRYVVVNTSVKH